MATNAGTLKLEINIPQVIALQFSEGKEVESQYTGTQVMYTLTDGRRWYVAPFVAQKITAAGVAAKMPFQACKRQHGKTVEIEIETHNQTKAAGATTPTASTSKAMQTTDVPVLNRSTNHFEMPGPPAPWPRHTPAQEAVIERKLEPTNVSAMANRILASYVVAFDVVAKLQQVCEERGMPLNFVREEHIRQIAATAFIESAKAARS
jgi:hypothetical protein